MTVSADAAPAKTHNLQVYKKQAYIVLDAYDPDAEFDGPALVNRKKFTVSCNQGDFAVDGTWTVDKVDDWNDDDGTHVAGDESQVFVTESVGRKRDGGQPEEHLGLLDDQPRARPGPGDGLRGVPG